MNIVFCADRKALPGLHVAAYSLLENISAAVTRTNFFVFSDALDQNDLALLRQTLSALNRPFQLELRSVDGAMFNGFPPLNGSWATYYRLAVPRILEVPGFLYVDADTLCDLDVSELLGLEMNDIPAGLVPEAPLSQAADRAVAEQLGNSDSQPYFNAGVIYVNVAEWRKQQITEKAMDYLARHRPNYWDQSALNVVLHKKAVSLDEKFNCIANMRKHWPALKQPRGRLKRLVHFLDYPKPWDLFGEWLHPQYSLWRSVLDQTALKDFRSWQAGPSRMIPKTSKARKAYVKSLKDRMLFRGYARGWLKQVKGVPVMVEDSRA